VRKAFFASIVDVIQPKVIISFIGTDPIMGELCRIFPNKLVISIQNGIRLTTGGFIHSRLNDFMLPHYFSFGDYEKELFSRNKILFKQIHSIGSLKLGVLQDEYLNYDHKFCGDYICFVSEYTLTKNNFENNRLNKHKSLYSNLVEMSNDCDFKVQVAMRNRGKDGYEENFFCNGFYAKNIELIFNKNFSTYKSGYESLVIINTISTLGFELFGLGKKVLFCGLTISDNFSEKEFLLFQKMPAFIVLNNLTRFEFNSKINALINMDNEEYLSLTKEAREYYMKCEKKYPHEVVSEFIADFMQKETLTVESNV
jgi:surface carbohydrate biosynthesis protein